MSLKDAHDTATATLTGRPTPADLGFLVFRVVVGGFFAYHGIWHFQKGMVWFAGLMERVNVPAPTLTAYVVALLEVVIGFCLIIGLGTRAWSVCGIMMMMVTGFQIKMAQLHTGFLGQTGSGGAETDFLYALCFLTLLSVGAGRYSVDAVLRTDSRLADLITASGRRRQTD
jgi:putative oxidoreductase